MCKQILLLLFGCFAAEVVAVTVSIDSVRQRYPWNGIIDAVITIDGADSERLYELEYQVKAEGITKSVSPLAEPYFGNIFGWPLTNGTFSVAFNLMPGFSEIVARNARLSVSVADCGAPTWPEDAVGTPLGILANVMTVDLSAGSQAEEFPISYYPAVDVGLFNCNAYKTQKLVLRAIPKGTYTIGYGTSTSDQTLPATKVTLKHDYWIGLWELTQKQYSNIMGSIPSGQSAYGDTYAVGCLNWYRLRGNVSAKAAPIAGGCLYALNQKTVYEGKHVSGWDLPVDAQWDIAARGNSTYQWVCATSSEVNNYGWTSANASGVKPVCSKLPNSLGLYDVHGNVWEMCRDVWVSSYQQAANPDEPYGTTGTYRLMRGGGYTHAVSFTRLGRRAYWEPDYVKGSGGCRLYKSMD